MESDTLKSREEVLYENHRVFTGRMLRPVAEELLSAIRAEGLWEIYANRVGHPPWVEQELEKARADQAKANKK